jgi:hypothetical protein
MPNTKCHCEEQSDEAISPFTAFKNEIASSQEALLAMTSSTIIGHAKSVDPSTAVATYHA